MAENNPNKELLKQIGTKLECRICLTDYTDPKLLPCFHTFCKKCLEPLVKQGRDSLSLQCPICRHSTRLSLKGVAGLQPNLRICHLFKTREVLKKVCLTGPGSRKISCEKCSDDEAAGFCRDCGQFICSTCVTVHRKWKEFETHEVISHEMAVEESKKLISLKKVDYCTRHPGRELRIFCETCSELICTDCTIGLHPRPEHSFNLVTDIFAEYEVELKESLEPVKEQLVNINELITSYDTWVKDIKENKKMVQADIHDQIDRIQHIIESRKGELLEKLSIIVNKKLKNLALQKDEVEQVQFQLSSCVDYAEESLKTSTAAEVIGMRDSVRQCIKQIAAKLEVVSIEPEEETNFKVTDISEDGKYELHEGISELLDIVEDSESEIEEWEESSQSEANALTKFDSSDSYSDSDSRSGNKEQQLHFGYFGAGDDNDYFDIIPLQVDSTLQDTNL